MPVFKKVVYSAAIVSSIYILDKHFYYSTFKRNLYTLYTGIIITCDYKLNFNSTHDIHALHQRTASRLYRLCCYNQGLYIKFGQQLAGVPVLPTPFLIFQQLYDKAPQLPYETVKRVLTQELNADLDNVFLELDPNPVAAASIAQVHRARTRDGTDVAVKIQRPEIQHQMFWDLQCYRLLMFVLEKVFDLPLYWSVDYIQKHLIQETDFINEANNAQSCKLFFQSVPALANSTHVPEVYWPLVTKRVLTCEWIEGISLSNVSKNNNYPFKIPQIMKTVVDIFANQIFVSGLVHCDPHPGNIIIRSDPVSKNPQVVVIDHGLYIQCSQSFKHDYALFWKSLFTLDSSTLDAIGLHWGMRDISFFASATLARPWKRGKLLHVNDKLVMKKSDFELQVETKQKLRQFLENSDKLPRELLAINKHLGTPVNRIQIMANWAVSALGSDWAVWNEKRTVKQSNLWSTYNYLKYHMILFVSSSTFYMSRIYQKVLILFGFKHQGMEQFMDDAILNHLRTTIPGIQINDDIFNS